MTVHKGHVLLRLHIFKLAMVRKVSNLHLVTSSRYRTLEIEQIKTRTIVKTSLGIFCILINLKILLEKNYQKKTNSNENKYEITVSIKERNDRPQTPINPYQSRTDSHNIPQNNPYPHPINPGYQSSYATGPPRPFPPQPFAPQGISPSRFGPLGDQRNLPNGPRFHPHQPRYAPPRHPHPSYEPRYPPQRFPTPPPGYPPQHYPPHGPSSQQNQGGGSFPHPTNTSQFPQHHVQPNKKSGEQKNDKKKDHDKKKDNDKNKDHDKKKNHDKKKDHDKKTIHGENKKGKQ